MGDDGIHAKSTLPRIETQVRNRSVSGLAGRDSELAAVHIPERRGNLGYVGAHGSFAQAEPFTTVLFSSTRKGRNHT